MHINHQSWRKILARKPSGSTVRYRTEDGGQTWEHLETVNWDGQFDFVSELVGFAVARSEEHIALVRTFDGGRSWELLVPILVR